jgi:hypothetical protein
MLSKNIELTLKVCCIECSTLRGTTVAIVRSKHDEGLEDCGLLAAGSRAENGPIGRNFSPSEYAESQVVRDCGENILIALKLNMVIGFEEHISNSIFSGIRKNAADIPLSLPLEEAVGDSSHNTGTVAVSTVSSCCASMGHGAEKRASIRHNFMTRFTLDMADEAYTT